MSEPQSPAIFALLNLHAELGGKIIDNKREATKLRASMKHVEAVLHLLQPGFNARKIAPRRRYNPNPLFKRGHVFRAALGVLRDAPGPMTVEEIAIALLRSRGVLEPTRDDLRRFYGAVAKSLENHRGETVESDQGHPRRWVILVPKDGGQR